MSTADSYDSARFLDKLDVAGTSYAYFSLALVEKELSDLSRLPVCIKILLENMLRNATKETAAADALQACGLWLQLRRGEDETPFKIGRILTNDISGLPAFVDMASMRDALRALQGDPHSVQPRTPTDLIISNSGDAERSKFFDWCLKHFEKLRIVHAVGEGAPALNLRLLSDIIQIAKSDTQAPLVFPDTFISTTPLALSAGALGVLGLAVGGTEAEMALLGQPTTLPLPEVLGIKLSGALTGAATGTDAAFALVQLLRTYQISEKCVEFYGPGISQIEIPLRALLSIVPALLGAISGLFPIDAKTIAFLQESGRFSPQTALAEAYAKAQGLWNSADGSAPQSPLFTQETVLDLGAILPTEKNTLSTDDGVLYDGMAAIESSLAASAPLPDFSPSNTQQAATSAFYEWDERATYVRRSAAFDKFAQKTEKLHDIKDARILAVFGDNVPTEKIAPMDAIPVDSPAGLYLRECGVDSACLDTYAARRGNVEIIARGTFAHPNLVNKMLKDGKGGQTRHAPSGEVVSYYAAARRYAQEKTPLVLFAGHNYGVGVARNWASKGEKALGIMAVIAESFSPVHRRNLVASGILPLVLKQGVTLSSLKLTGDESVSIAGASIELRPHMDMIVTISSAHATDRHILRCMIESAEETAYFKQGGILPYTLRSFLPKD